MGKRRSGADITPGKKGVSHGIKKAKSAIKDKPAKKSLQGKLNAQLLVKAAIKGEVVNRVKADSLDGVLSHSNLRPKRNSRGKATLDRDDKDSDTDDKENVKREELVDQVKVEPSDGLVKVELKEEIKEESHSDDLDDDPDLCDYEKMQKENIRMRQKMFANLLIDDAKSRVSDIFNTSKEKSSASKRGLASEKREKEILPPRKSARLAGGKVPEIDRYIPLSDNPEEERADVELATLGLSDTAPGGDQEKVERMQAFLSDYVAEMKKEKSPVSQLSPSFGTVKDHKAKFNKLKITEERVAKVVPDRIFSIAVHPSNHKVLVAAGGKWGGVGLWDPAATQDSQHGVHLHTPHSRPVNCLTWDRFNPHHLVSTSYDGSSRIFDIERQETRVLYGDQSFINSGGYSTMHVQVDSSTFLISRGKTGCVGLVDTRVGWDCVVQDYRLFERLSAKCIDLHPLQPTHLLAANNKGGCFIFDTRKQGKVAGGLMTPVCELTGHTKSVSSCLFSPLTGDKVVTISYDDRLRLFATSKLSGTIRGKETRHCNQTGRWLTPFKACWHPRQEGLLLTGSMGRPREMEVWSAAGDTLDRMTSLQGECLASICSVMAVHPTRDLVAGGNSSGRVHIFM